MTTAPRLLLAAPACPLRVRLSGALAEAGIDHEAVAGAEEARRELRSRPAALLIAASEGPAAEALALLRSLRSSEPAAARLPVLLVSDRAALGEAVEAGRWGAADVFERSEGEVERLVARARALLAEDPERVPDELAGESRAARALRARAAALAELAVPVLLHGAPHTGHDALAAWMHARSERATHPLLRVEGGAPGGALEPDAPGTLHVAGVEALGAAEQQRLREALRRPDALRGGGGARLLASTSADLAAEVEGGRLDAELAARLARFSIRLPELRERRADLPALLARFLRRGAERLGRPAVHLEPAAAARLTRQPWPRNFLDLERVAESLVAFARGGAVTAECADAALAELDSPLQRIASRRRCAERRLLLELYEKHGTYTGVAHELGLTRNAAKYRFAKHGLIPDDARAPG